MKLGIALAVWIIGVACQAPAADDELLLFDGKSLAGWTAVEGKPGNWSVEEGNLVTHGEGGGWLSTDAMYGDFVLTLDYQVGPAGNSGVFIRAPRMGDPAYTGMEIQVLDDAAPVYKNLKPSQYCGSVYGVEATQRGQTKPAGEWNTMEITARGTKITVALNGKTVVATDLKDHADAEKAHPGIKRPGGYIGLQSHNDPVRYRNIKIKNL